MKRRILLVDDEVAVLLTLKAVLEISGFDVDTAASAREGKLKLRSHEYHMVISDMRMESDASGAEVIKAARAAACQPAVALLSAFPLADEDWQELGADKMLVKPMHTRILLEQIENLLTVHEAAKANSAGPSRAEGSSAEKATKKTRASLSAQSSHKPAKSAKKSSKKAPASGLAKKPVQRAAAKTMRKKLSSRKP
ncbi:response regulator [Edaphobacter bradus]|uniref:response regulator n=1 Tax=Edaphobacter bradus TaxID=2259016 RepID=UPI0021E0C1C1|nr:response regulator [Edaphobacter bradus]